MRALINRACWQEEMASSPFQRNLLILMRAHHLDMSTLADRIGYTQKAVSLWVNGQRSPKPDAVAAIADEFGLSMDTVWRGSVL